MLPPVNDVFLLTTKSIKNKNYICSFMSQIIIPDDVKTQMKDLYPKTVNPKYFFVFETLTKRQVFNHPNGHKVTENGVLATIKDAQKVLPFFSQNW